MWKVAKYWSMFLLFSLFFLFSNIKGVREKDKKRHGKDEERQKKGEREKGEQEKMREVVRTFLLDGQSTSSKQMIRKMKSKIFFFQLYTFYTCNKNWVCKSVESKTFRFCET